MPRGGGPSRAANWLTVSSSRGRLSATMIRRLAVGVPLTVLLSVTAWLALSPVSSAPGDTVADRVFGQGGSFNSALCNPEGTSATSLCFSSGVAVDSVGNVFVADAFNNRVLEYDTPLTTDTIADRVCGQGGSFSADSCNVGASGLA